jgi:hypothetical protein
MNEHAVHMALRNQALSALPAKRAWENSEPASAPTPSDEYVTESFEPDGGRLYGVRDGGTVKDDGLYILTWYGLANRGTQALSTSLRTLLDLFPPGSKIAATDGSYVHIKGDVIPWRTKIQTFADAPGRAVSVVRIPFFVLTVNPS